MSAAADVLGEVRRISNSVVDPCPEWLAEACVEAVTTNEVVRARDYLLLPDTERVALRSSRIVPPRTATLSWPDDHAIADLRGRSVWVYAALPEDPRPRHPDDMANRY